jgi:hypothetical protein
LCGNFQIGFIACYPVAQRFHASSGWLVSVSCSM